ncbi:MAG: LVIVD repeat-containing protein [Limnobacter sp.]|uniref:LVIVD repeat-containing protein n=1 Tax=Limnobacter sp. TaxID=2003368 RepID=UPI003918F41C
MPQLLAFSIRSLSHLALMVVLFSLCLGGCLSSNDPATATNAGRVTGSQANLDSDLLTINGCAPGDSPEPDIQGRVPLADRQSGRSQQGYQCNLKRIGQFQGEGTTWVNPSTSHCAYMATAFSGIGRKKLPGVQVVDVTTPTNPRFVKSLDSAAFTIGTWESLKINEPRQLLAGVAVGPIVIGLFVDIYDISGDCTQPKLLNGLAGPLTVPANFLGHEGNFSPDGKTYWATSSAGGSITAINLDDPSKPRLAYIGNSILPNHGFSFNEAGTRMYLTLAAPGGVLILDVSDVQARKPVPIVRPVGQLLWTDGSISQHTIPISFKGVPHLIVVDEFGTGATRILNIADEGKPFIVSRLRLEIQQAANADKRREDLGNNGLFGYEAHYCEVDRTADPQALACGYFQSGVRVFDIRDPLKPREIAYYNPPAQRANKAILTGSEHAASPAGFGPSLSDLQKLGFGIPTSANLSGDMSTDWCSSPPRFVNDQLWVSCQDNGFMVLEFAPGVYPFKTE